MKSLKTIVLTLLSVLLVSGGLMAQVDLISAQDFKALQKANKDLIIVDASKSKVYKASHLKGAMRINHMDLYKDGDISGLVKSPEELAAYFGKKGISEKSAIVVHDGGTQKYSSRLYWILKYIGAENVKVMHKDKAQWAKARLMQTSAVPAAKKAVTFTASVNADVYADLAYVKEKSGTEGVVLVDSRTKKEFDGGDDSKTPVIGHIPGAIHLDYMDLLTDTGAFKSKEALKKIADANGLSAEKEIIVHCKTGIKGSVTYIALKNILGFEKVRLYDGSCSEWVTKYKMEL